MLNINSIMEKEQHQKRSSVVVKNYDKDFYRTEEEHSKSFSSILMPYLLERLNCKSIVDFGCGVGEYLNLAKKYMGIEKVRGLDGEWVREYLEIEQDEFLSCDLTQDIDLKEKYDLAICLEVAEHLPRERAKTFIGNLVRHADIVLFSAAIPHQGGTYHVNEQYPSYWKKIFEAFNFSLCDCVRNHFWNDEKINEYYKQNIFIYCKSNLEQEILEKFKHEETPVDIVHPNYWEKRNVYSYLFPFEKVQRNTKIVIYGAGKVGKIFVNQLLATDYAEIVLWCDRSFKDYEFGNISDPRKIKSIQFDNIIIATEKEKLALEMMDYLAEMGISNERIIWRSPMFRNKY